MPELQGSRQKLKIAVIAMIAVDLVSAAILLSPLVGSEESRQVQIRQLTSELLQKNREVAPLRGMGESRASRFMTFTAKPAAKAPAIRNSMS